MPRTQNKKKNYFTIFGNLTMTKGVYDHDLTSIRVFCPKANFLSKKFYTFQKILFSLFTGLYITPITVDTFSNFFLYK